MSEGNPNNSKKTVLMAVLAVFIGVTIMSLLRYFDVFLSEETSFNGRKSLKQINHIRLLALYQLRVQLPNHRIS